MNNQLKLLFYIVFVALIFFFVQNRFELFDVQLLGQPDQGEKKTENDAEKDGSNYPYLEIYNMDQNVVRVNLELADEDYERRLGLSGRKELGEYNGMLFMFGSPGSYSFWMKEMLIPLDILFIDTQGFIVDIREGLEPCTPSFCPNVISKAPFKYALEVNSGFVKNNNIKEGNSIVLSLEGK